MTTKDARQMQLLEVAHKENKTKFLPFIRVSASERAQIMERVKNSGLTYADSVRNAIFRRRGRSDVETTTFNQLNLIKEAQKKLAQDGLSAEEYSRTLGQINDVLKSISASWTK